MLVKRLTDALGDELNDLEPGFEHVRWPLVRLFEYITEAIEQIAALKPELFVVTQVVTLQPGAAQPVPAGIAKLLDIPANVNADGSIGDPVLPANYNLTRYFTKRSCLTGAGKVSSFRVDPNNPRTFFVEPPNPGYPEQKVQLLGQASIVPVVALTDNIVFTGGDASMYFNAMKDWALYRAFMKDTESQTSVQRAGQHYKAFYQFLNVKMQMDVGRKVQAKRSTPEVIDNGANV